MLDLIFRADAAILLFIQAHLRTDALTPVMVFFSTLGNAGIAWIVLGLILTAIPKTRKYGVLALASLLACYLLNNILLKNLVARARPYTRIAELTMLMRCPSDASFPSGHACSSFATAGSLFCSLPRRFTAVRFGLIAVAALIALSRLYVGVHYPTDVLVGVLIGLIGSRIVTRRACAPYDRLCARMGGK